MEKSKCSEQEWYKLLKDIIIPASIFIIGFVATCIISGNQTKSAETISAAQMEADIWHNIYKIKNSPDFNNLDISRYLMSVIKYNVTGNDKVLDMVRGQVKEPLRDFITTKLKETDAGGETTKLIKEHLIPLYKYDKFIFVSILIEILQKPDWKINRGVVKTLATISDAKIDVDNEHFELFNEFREWYIENEKLDRYVNRINYVARKLNILS